MLPASSIEDPNDLSPAESGAEVVDKQLGERDTRTCGPRRAALP
jgi:hypothetical protein